MTTATSRSVRSSFVRTLAAAVAVAGFASATSGCGASSGPTEAPRTAAEQPTEGRVGVHGMVIFGPSPEGSVYISHIPLYSQPEDFQIVARAHLTALPGDYIPKDLHDGMYTIEPDPFSLDKMISGQLTSFQANLYQGFFEDRAKRWAHGMKVDIDAMVFPARPLDPKAPHLTEPTFVAFGSPKDAFLVHVVGGAPDYDQVLYGHITSGVGDVTLGKGLSVTAKGKANDPGARVRTGDKVKLTAADGNIVQMDIVKELSCLTGEGFNQQCPN